MQTQTDVAKSQSVPHIVPELSETAQVIPGHQAEVDISFVKPEKMELSNESCSTTAATTPSTSRILPLEVKICNDMTGTEIPNDMVIAKMVNEAAHNKRFLDEVEGYIHHTCDAYNKVKDGDELHLHCYLNKVEKIRSVLVKRFGHVCNSPYDISRVSQNDVKAMSCLFDTNVFLKTIYKQLGREKDAELADQLADNMNDLLWIVAPPSV